MLYRFGNPAPATTTHWRSWVVAAGLALAALPAARAQTALGQPSLDEAKVQIWCATARYVYADLGRPRLQSTLRCQGGALPELAASLRPDSLRVYSLLYQPIEERGRIYKGLKDNHARLAALVRAIVGKLGASAARRRDPARLAGLHELEKKLTDYVETGLPPTTVAPAPEADTETTLSGPAEAAETGAAPAAAPVPAPVAAAPRPLLDRLLAPLALTFSLLSLVLYVLLRLSLGRTLRQLRRSAARLDRPATDLTPAQRQQVEELVARRVAEATGRPAAPGA